jgi:hypothetical protein
MMNDRPVVAAACAALVRSQIVGVEITKLRPKSRRALPEIVFATSPTRSRTFCSPVSVSFMHISMTESMPRGAVKYTLPSRLPEMPMTPV